MVATTCHENQQEGAAASRLTELVVLWASLLAPALPWLNAEGYELAGLWLINAVIVGSVAIRPAAVKAIARNVSPRSVLGLALILLLAGTALTGLVVPEPFYGPPTWAAIAHGSVIGGSALVLFSRPPRHRSGELVAVAACAAGYTGLLGLPLLIDAPAVMSLLATFGSGSAQTVVSHGYRPLFEAIDAHQWVDLPVGRGPNLRHEPALLFVLALAPVPPPAAGSKLLAATRVLAVAGIVLSLSRSTIVAAGAVGVLTLLARGRRVVSGRRVVTSLAALAAVALVWASRLGAGIVERLSGRGDHSAATRAEALGSAYDLAGRSPLGLAASDLSPELGRPHVFLLDALLGAGLLGLASSVLLIAVVAGMGRRAYRTLSLANRRDPGSVPEAATATAGVVLAAAVVVGVRFVTAGSFLHASIAWYGVGAMLGHRERTRQARSPHRPRR